MALNTCTDSHPERTLERGSPKVRNHNYRAEAKEAQKGTVETRAVGGVVGL